MATRWKVSSFVLLLAVMAVMVPVQTAWGYSQGAHRHIIQKATEYFAGFRPCNEPWQYRDAIADGAEHEDDGNDEDHVFGYNCDGAAIATCTYPHFWDYDGDNGISGNGIDDLVDVVSDTWPNAWMKASGYRVGEFHNVSLDGLWQQALELYRQGNLWDAYERLGHVCHLLADMSVPTHVHEDFHPSPDEYEHTISANITDVLSVLDPTELNKGFIPIPANNTGIAPELWDLFYLMYTTNQRADYFGSEDDWGDAKDWLNLVDYNTSPYATSPYSVFGYYQDPDHYDTPIWTCYVCGSLQCIGDEDSACKDTFCINCFDQGRGWQPLHMTNPQWIIAERVTLVYAVRATATLFDTFLREGDNVPPVTSIMFGNNQYISQEDQISISPATHVFLTATDNYSGVQSTEYRITGQGYDSGWKINTSIFTFNQVQAGLYDGKYTIQYRSSDDRNNEETAKTVVVSLTTNPADYRVSLSTGRSFLGIQAAIDAASRADSSLIEVKPGIFRECVDFDGKAITLRSTGGPEVTTIDGTGGLHVVSFVNAEGYGSILDGFTITGGNANGVGFPGGCGGGILCKAAQPVIRNCIITNNLAGDGGGIFMLMMFPILQDCLICNNTANNGGGLLSLYSQPTIANCTFSANKSRAQLGGGAIASSANGTENTPILVNCILSGNTPSEILYSTVSPIIFDSNIRQEDPWLGERNINQEPKFVDAENGNYRLAADSPCIGTGNNLWNDPQEMDLDGYPRILDGLCKGGTAVVDMGAYEFSYAFAGDLDADCAVGLADLAMMAAEWMTEPVDRTMDIAPGPAGDGAVNLADFAVISENWIKMM